MNGYVALWAKQRIEVYADTAYEAQEAAREVFQKGTRKKVKGYDIIITLCEKDGKEVIHTAS